MCFRDIIPYKYCIEKKVFNFTNISLNFQMEAEKASLAGDKQALEQERLGIREELVRVEQEKMDLDTEKMGRYRLVTQSVSNLIRLETSGEAQNL